MNDPLLDVLVRDLRAQKTKVDELYLRERSLVSNPGTTLNLPIGAATLASATQVFVQTHHDAISFADAATQSAYWSLKLPPGWAGRNLTARLVWAPSSTNTGDCRWVIALYLQKAGTTLSASAEDADTSVQAGNGTADRPQVHTNGGTLSLANFAEGDSLSFRVARTGADAGDTFTGDARLLAVELVVTG